MQKFLYCFVLLSLTAVILTTATAQISITASDLSTNMAVGALSTGRNDTATHTLNIGTPGMTSWDASALSSHFSGTATSVVPDTTPYFGTYPGATHTQRSAVTGATYTYYTLGANLLFPGTATFSSFFTVVIKKTPAEIVYQLPMTLGTTWTTSFVDSTTSTFSTQPPVVNVNNQTVTYTVDAYGDLTMPGGAVYQAIRLRSDRRITSGLTSTRKIFYNILTKIGASVGILAADTLQPNSGVINPPAFRGIALLSQMCASAMRYRIILR